MSEFLNDKINRFERAGWVLHWTNQVDGAELRAPANINDGALSVFIDGNKIEAVEKTARGSRFVNITKFVGTVEQIKHILHTHGTIDPNTAKADGKPMVLFEFVVSPVHCLTCGQKPVYVESEATKLHTTAAHICPHCGAMFIVLAHSTRPASIDEHVLLQEAREFHRGV